MNENSGDVPAYMEGVRPLVDVHQSPSRGLLEEGAADARQESVLGQWLT
jgi:hypothetical protein